MNALSNIARAEAMHDLFEAWIPGDQTSRRVDTLHASTLAEARDAAQGSCSHKDHLIIKQTSRPSGEATIHVFYVKQKAATWVRQPGFAHPVQVRPLEAELRFSMPVDAFAPVEPWRWSPGCDPVGAKRELAAAIDVPEARTTGEG
jgi:hypothetical protein